MLARKTAKNQVTLPRPIVEQFPAVDYFDVTTEHGRIVLRPIEMDPLARVHARLADDGIRETSVPRALAWARRRRG